MNPAEQNVENLFKNLQKESEEASEPERSGGERSETPKAFPQDKKTDNTREELITLAESGKIKYAVNYIKKASNDALDKIKADYERKHLDETNDYITDNILSSVTKLLKYFELLENPDELEQDLKKNYLLKRDVKNIVGTITHTIPYVGLLCGGITVGKHVALNALNGSKETGEPSKIDPNVNTNG